MNMQISARDRRMLVRGVAAIAALVALGRVIPGIHGWASERRAAAESLRLESARVERSARDALLTRGLLHRARERLIAYDSATLDAGSHTRASAMLAALVRDAADASEAQLGPLQLHSDTSANSLLSRVSVRASVTGDLESFALFVEGLEAGPELLAIREFNIVQPDPGLSPDRPETLRGEVLVEAVFRTPTAERAPR